MFCSLGKIHCHICLVCPNDDDGIIIIYGNGCTLNLTKNILYIVTIGIAFAIITSIIKYVLFEAETGNFIVKIIIRNGVFV